MESGNPILDNLFNGLSSIYRTDNGMLNSNLFTVLNSYAQVLTNVQDNLNQVSADTYISTADDAALESNFGVLVNFPKPPQLNTLSQGEDIYRAMLKAMFRTFLSGSTTASMQQALGIAVSYLTVDPNTTSAERVTNYTHLYATSSGITLPWPPVQASGNNVIGPARTGAAASGDIAFFPTDLVVTNYNPATNVISFTGTVNTGTNYAIFYYRDNTQYNGTNWINLTNPTGVAINPQNLIANPISSYDNPIFSYWWNTYNALGNGIVIDQSPLSGTDSSLVWRLPEKTIQFLSPYSQQVITQTTDFYNLSGTVYNIEQITPTNPDTLFNDIPINYYSDVSSDFTKYYIRYSSNNNGPSTALSTFLGSLPLFTKHYNSISFPSSNFGNLDFFEKNSTFDINNLFGTGTANVWLDVPNIDGEYTLNNDNILQRNFSLHEDIMYFENFEGGQLSRIGSTNWSGTRITDVVGVPLYHKNDCLMLFGLASGVSVSASPILNAQTTANANDVSIDFYDGFNTGTSTTMTIVRTGTSNQYNALVFGIDTNLKQFQLSNQDPFVDSENFGFIETYFASTGSTNRVVNVNSANTNAPYSYNLIDGTNPNTIFSTQSMQPSGITYVIPNATNALMTNSNEWFVQYNDRGAGYTVFEIQSYVTVGTYISHPPPFGFPTPVTVHGTQVYTMIARSGSQFWTWQSQSPEFIASDGSVVYGNNGGTTSIPYITGLNTIDVVRGSGVTINGVFYGGYLGGAWGNLGIVNNEGNAIGQVLNAGDPSSIRMTASDLIQLDHYYIANNTLRQQFYNSINNYSGIGVTNIPYYYQIFNAANQTEASKVYLNQFPREEGWHTLNVDFGTVFTGTVASVDAFNFLNASTGFSGNIASTSGVSMSTKTSVPLHEYSYFDNVTVSYYDPNKTLPMYDLSFSLEDDWEGSALSQSTILDNRFFQLDPQPNFEFDVTIQGLDPQFIFIIQNIIQRLKPAHTIATSIFEQVQSLETSSQIPVISNTGSNWETGNIQNNIIVEITGQTVVPPNGLPFYITISGT